MKAKRLESESSNESRGLAAKAAAAGGRFADH